MEYPDQFIRGIINEQYIVNGVPDSALFKEFKINESKESNYAELSINWYDDELAIIQMMSQMDEAGERIYKVGVAILSRIELDRLCIRNPVFRDNVKYERDPIMGINDYHGNILLKKDLLLPKPQKKIRDLIAANIAGSCYVDLLPANT